MESRNWSRADLWPKLWKTKMAKISFGNSSKTIHISFCRQCIMKRITSWSLLPNPLYSHWQSVFQKYFETRDNLCQTMHMSTEQDLGGICRHMYPRSKFGPRPSSWGPLFPPLTIICDLFSTTEIQTPFRYLFLFPWIVHTDTEVIKCAGRIDTRLITHVTCSKAEVQKIVSYWNYL